MHVFIKYRDRVFYSQKKWFMCDADEIFQKKKKKKEENLNKKSKPTVPREFTESSFSHRADSDL